MKKITWATAAIAVLVCATAEAEQQRISIGFSGSGYNQVANQYLEAATFAKIQTARNGNDLLVIEVDDPVWSDFSKAYLPRTIRLQKANVPEYIAAIDKYEKWADIATRDGDMITKEITRVKTRSGKLRFRMHSGNATQHYLVVDFCAVGACLDDSAVYFTLENARGFRETLDKFGAGELQFDAGTDDKYK